MYIKGANCLFATLVAASLLTILAGIVPEENSAEDEETTTTSGLSGNETNEYVIKSVQYEIGVMESEENGSGDNDTTSEPVSTDKLSETQVAFFLPPASPHDSTESTTEP